LLGDGARVAKYSVDVKRIYFESDRGEEIVLEYIFHRLINKAFAGRRRSADYVRGFVSSLASGPAGRRLSREDLELAILEKLGLTSNLWNFADKRNELFIARMAISWEIVHRGVASEAELIDLVVDSEKAAHARGIDLARAEW
jgi:hypothetical protein